MKVKMTITESNCRSGYFKAGDEFIVEDLCPPLCHELWNVIYPYVFALQNGVALIMDATEIFSLMQNVQMGAEFASMVKSCDKRRTQ